MWLIMKCLPHAKYEREVRFVNNDIFCKNQAVYVSNKLKSVGASNKLKAVSVRSKLVQWKSLPLFCGISLLNCQNQRVKPDILHLLAWNNL